MSLHSLPHLILSLGAEMLYVLDQRLNAQEIAADKRARVLNDIITNLTASKFIGKLLRPGTLYSSAVVSDIFTRLSKCTIMRLNKTSMEKLYDLMTMGVKYQLLFAQHPGDILHILANHLDAVESFASANSASLVVLSILDAMKTLSHADLAVIRGDLLNFFHVSHIKISMFLLDGSQANSGAFNLPTTGPLSNDGVTRRPGAIRFYSTADAAEPTSSASFVYPHTSTYVVPRSACSYTDKLRDCTLGMNMYYADRKTLGPRAVYVDASTGLPLLPGSGLGRELPTTAPTVATATESGTATSRGTADGADKRPSPAAASASGASDDGSDDELAAAIGVPPTRAVPAAPAPVPVPDPSTRAPPSSRADPSTGPISAPPPIVPFACKAPTKAPVRASAADWSNAGAAEAATLADLIRPPTQATQGSAAARNVISVDLFPGGRPSTAIRKANADGGGSPTYGSGSTPKYGDGAKACAFGDDADDDLVQGEVVVTRLDRKDMLRGVMADMDVGPPPTESVAFSPRLFGNLPLAVPPATPVNRRCSTCWIACSARIPYCARPT